MGWVGVIHVEKKVNQDAGFFSKMFGRAEISKITHEHQCIKCGDRKNLATRFPIYVDEFVPVQVTGFQQASFLKEFARRCQGLPGRYRRMVERLM